MEGNTKRYLKANVVNFVYSLKTVYREVRFSDILQNTSIWLLLSVTSPMF